MHWLESPCGAAPVPALCLQAAACTRACVKGGLCVNTDRVRPCAARGWRDPARRRHGAAGEPISVRKPTRDVMIKMIYNCMSGCILPRHSNIKSTSCYTL